MKVVINDCYGGFGLSDEAITRYAEIKGIQLWPETSEYGHTIHWTCPPEERQDGHGPHLDEYLLDRDDPVLIQVVEELGAKADGKYAKLKIVEIPDWVRWQVSEYDGNEWIAEEHRTWS